MQLKGFSKHMILHTKELRQEESIKTGGGKTYSKAGGFIFKNSQDSLRWWDEGERGIYPLEYWSLSTTIFTKT